MEPRTQAYREIHVPVSLFGTLRKQLSREIGPLPTIHALHAAGFEAGLAASSSLRSSGDPDLAQLPDAVFWARVAAFFSRRGWGTLQVTTTHPAVGLLVSQNWAECSDAGSDGEAACSFTSGFLSGLLTRVAGGPIAVLEVACRGRADDRCCFAFGSEAAIHDLYGRLLEGSDLDRALAEL